MPVTLLNWIVPVTILLCGAGLISIGYLGFTTARWGHALCVLAVGYALMLFETDRFTPFKQIVEDNFILLGILLTCRALQKRLNLKSSVPFDVALMVSSTTMIAISLVIFQSVRLETFFVQACCALALWTSALPFSKLARTRADRLLAATFLLFSMLLTFQCLLFIAAPDIDHVVGAWRSSIWGNLIQYTGLMGSIMLAFAVMAATSWDTIEKYRAHANTDPMTNLLNRRGLDALLASPRGRLFQNGSTAVILADIDRFKAINDRFGHPFGDHVITRFGAILEAQAGPKGCVVRLGGEEFAVLLPGSSLDNAVATASRMQRAFALERWLHIETDDQFTASFGLALVKDQESIADAIGRADRLLYAAKRAGRDCIVVDHCLSTDCKDCRREVNGYPACPDAPSI
ncbi:GGDEF domain-containing protein, partial [Novosphingobium sp. SCN 63-17]